MPETIASEVLAASLGGAVSATVLYPLEVLKVKLQAEESSSSSGDQNGEDETATGTKASPTMIEYARKLYERQGLQVFFQGVEVSAMQSALEKSLYFFAYTGLKHIHRAFLVFTRRDPSLGVMTNLLLGCAAEWAHLPITLPVDAWTTRIQTSSGTTTGGNPDQSKSALKILLSMLDEKTNFYKGIEAYTLLCFKPALQYTVYEQVKKVLLIGKQGRDALSASEAFVLGMVARTVSTVIVFPFIRAKVIMQARNETSIVKVLQDMIQNKTLFQGIAPELTRGVLSSALMLMIKERISVIVRKLLK